MTGHYWEVGSVLYFPEVSYSCPSVFVSIYVDDICMWSIDMQAWLPFLRPQGQVQECLVSPFRCRFLVSIAFTDGRGRGTGCWRLGWEALGVFCCCCSSGLGSGACCHPVLWVCNGVRGNGCCFWGGVSWFLGLHQGHGHLSGWEGMETCQSIKH